MRNKLTEMQGEPPEDLFLEYIVIMIGNGKKMSEISMELKDFFGEAEAQHFADSLATELMKYTPQKSNVTSSVELPKATTVTKRISSVAQNVGVTPDLKELSSGREKKSQPQNSGRLLQTALNQKSADNRDFKKRKSTDIDNTYDVNKGIYHYS